MYLLKLGFRPWKRAPLSQLFSVFSGGVILFLAGAMIWGQMVLGPVVKKIRSEQVITAYLDPAVEPAQESKVVDTIRETLGAQRVSEIRLVDSRAFLEQLKDQAPEITEELAGLGGELELVVPRYITVSGRFDTDVQDKIRSLANIKSVESSFGKTLPVSGAFSTLRWGMVLFAAGLILAGLLGWIHLSRAHAQFLADVVPFLRHWGASRSAAHFPQVFAGFSVGFFSGALAFVAWMWGAVRTVALLKAISPVFSELPMPPFAWGLALWGLGIGFGLMAGAASSAMSLTDSAVTKGAGAGAGSGGRAWL